MSGGAWGVLRALGVFAVGSLLLSLSASAQSSFERGVEAYRRGDAGAAVRAWEQTLGEPLEALGRARVYLNLGNAHWRAGAELEAVACYTAALRLDPRQADARANLALARAKLGLAPADAGDLGATLERLVTSLRPGERRLVLFGALVLWSALLVLELSLGGAAARAGLLAASLVLALAAVPWAHGLLVRPRSAPMLALAKDGVSLRSEPLEARPAVGELAPFEEVERIDALPGWVRVERADGLRGWARAESLFALQLAHLSE